MPSKQVRDCIAIYDWTKPVDLLAWLALALTYFERVHAEPNEISASVGDEEESKGHSLQSLRSLISTNFPVGSITLYATMPSYSQVMFGWTVTAQIVIRNERTGLVSWPAGRLDHARALRELALFLGPAYGIGFQRDLMKGPDAYAYGMAAGLGYMDNDRIEADRIGRWFRERLSNGGENRHLSGLLRDIYHLNLLTDSHIAQYIEGGNLQTWINRDPARGKIESLCEGQWIWSLEQSQIEPVRAVLSAHNLLIAG